MRKSIESWLPETVVSIIQISCSLELLYLLNKVCAEVWESLAALTWKQSSLVPPQFINGSSCESIGLQLLFAFAATIMNKKFKRVSPSARGQTIDDTKYSVRITATLIGDIFDSWNKIAERRSTRLNLRVDAYVKMNTNSRATTATCVFDNSCNPGWRQWRRIVKLWIFHDEN